jgi:DNA-binding IscR family transcriptional regulator
VWRFRDFGPAARVLARLAAAGPSAFLGSEVLARAAGMRRQYLFELLSVTIQVGILRSWLGPDGGYWLAWPAAGITLLEVAELVDGPVRGDVPQTVTGADAKIDRRLQAAEIVRRNLGRVSVAELAGGRKGGYPGARPNAGRTPKGTCAPENSARPYAEML